MRSIFLLTLALALAGCSDSETTLPVNDDTGADAELCEAEVLIGVGSGAGDVIYDDCSVVPNECLERGYHDGNFALIYEAQMVPCDEADTVNAGRRATIDACYPPGEALNPVCP